ncbi:MAG: A/G-specific adenine glycosylase [Planctomycetota bacterium]
MDFAARLLRWFDGARRDLPWRRTRDPWAIWVSEVMLQQTRVAAVTAAYDRFLTRFPDPSSFASANDDEMLLVWKGLGYYRRARLLRDGARAVVAEHGGRVPSDPDQLGRLPGVGRYTRGAIGSIAFGHALPAIDGNVERVVARHRGIADDIATARAQKAVAAVVGAWMNSRPGDFNQALMELGATVCTPSRPDCSACPVAQDCEGRRRGIAGELPHRRPRRTPVAITARAALVVHRGRALGARVPDDEPNAGQLELPGTGILVDSGLDELASAIRSRYGALLQLGAAVAEVRHAITHHRITFVVHAATVRDRGTLSWFAIAGDTPWTTPTRKVFARLAAAEA